MKLKFHQIDRAVAALEYFSTRTKEIKSEDGKVTLVSNPCVFSGPVTWDIAANEAALRDALNAHRMARGNILQAAVAAGMKATEPNADVIRQTNELDCSAEYDIDIIKIPEAAWRAEENKIPSSYRAAIHFMVDFSARAEAE